ncbi:nucleotidyltransferase domain-containing protein [Salipaludibacillus aurantiacus]|uniref:Uncharacterized nucleotidyltransferase n=1 Tax=Salipaludibacillus aurantiacus TaxID=1601833 RepID=A0A1H9UKX2_9BACI|nr:nucleotidyltransferase family protein [Salipaludibacillus aurantiacus]SES10106.1 Uncharacterised nucleotidyltransferase [Salipaludibacillus aurantiacus]
MDNQALGLRQLPQELKLILALLQERNHDVYQNPRLLTTINWDLFIELCVHHRLYPLLYPEIKKQKGKVFPPSVVETLFHYYQQNTFNMLHLCGETAFINKLFTENNIRLLFLKGPHLARELYGDYSLRTSNDLDFLIQGQDLETAEKLLEKHGYEKEDYIRTVLNDWKWRHHHVTYYHPDKGTKLEVHWRLHPGPGKEPDFNDLWARRKTGTFTETPVCTLGKEDLFVFLALHGARHGWSRLRWLCDIHQLTGQALDQVLLKKLLKASGSVHIGEQALRLSAILMNTAIPEGKGSFRFKKRSEKLADRAFYYFKNMVNLHTDPVPEEVSEYHKHYLFSLMSYPQKAVFLLSFLYPYPEDAETMPLPKPLHFLYFPLRPFLWAWRKTRKQAVT